MAIKSVVPKSYATGEQVSFETQAKDVLFDNGKDLQKLYGEIEGDIFSPTIIQENASSQIGVGTNTNVHDNVQDGAFKSAILNGQTLVNLCGDVNSKVQISTQNIFNFPTAKKGLLKNSQKYLVVFYGLTGKETRVVIGDSYNGHRFLETTIPLNSTVYKAVLTSSTTVSNENVVDVYFAGSGFTSEDKTSKKILLLEYQDGMENWNIPYFTGMSSVQMPVLTVRGKNLWNNNIFDGVSAYDKINNGYVHKTGRASVPLKGLKPLTRYLISYGDVAGSGCLGFRAELYDNGVKFADKGSVSKAYYAFTTPSNTDSLTINLWSSTTQVADSGMIGCGVTNILIEEMSTGTTPTTYETHKTSILKPLEAITLGGVGTVKDTFNCLTGEVISNTTETILNGTNSTWSLHVSNAVTNVFKLASSQYLTLGIKTNTPMVCDKLPFGISGDVEKINNTTELFLALDKTKVATVDALTQWLNTNPITIRYQKSTSAVKTVALSGTLFGYKGGHVSIGSGFEGKMVYRRDGFNFPYDVNVTKVTTLSGVNISITNIVGNGTSIIEVPLCVEDEDYIVTCTPVNTILPKLEYQVPTSRTGQITQNTNIIMKHDKKIYSLEMMLMSSSVDDAYARYMLQNDVQVARFTTMSDDANLNPLRYHMLVRLIEEGMYEEIDMLDKLDTFFMYGEISMDQYFELTDVVLGLNVEDDFVEEV